MILIDANSHNEARNFGLQQVHFANATDEPIYILVGERPGWTIVDVFADVALLALGVEEVKGVLLAADAAEIPATIETFGDLIKFARGTAKLLSGTVATGSRPVEAAKAFVEAFKKDAICIKPGTSKNVLDAGVLNTFLAPSGIAGLLHANTVEFIAMSDDGSRVASWTSGSDMSWVAMRDHKIYRAKYGTLFIPDTQQPEGIDFQKKGDKDYHISTNRTRVPTVVSMGR